jgi:AcrR family transcriptional regulator
MLRYIPLDKRKKKRSYTSPVRRRQADDTRRRILEATRHLLETEGYAGMTIDAIARGADVSAQSVYSIFKSKAGVLTAMLDRVTFGGEYEETVRRALSAEEPETRLCYAARIARQIHDARSAAFDLLRGARVVAPELARLELRGENLRYERQEEMIAWLRQSGSLRRGLTYRMARDIFWMYTGRDVYRMLVRERGWSSRRYERWLGKTLVETLVRPGKLTPGAQTLTLNERNAMAME